MSQHIWKLVIILLSFSPIVHAQGRAHTWGGASTDSLVATSRDTDGNLYAAGSISSFGVGGNDALLLKYDSSGNIIWTKTWGGASDDYAAAVEVDPTGNNIYVTGRTQSFGAGWYDVFLLKFDAAGNLLWYKTWGGGSYDSGNDIAFDSSGNILVAAEAYSYNPPGTGSSSAAILKFTPDGNLLWSRVWGANAVGGPTYNGGYSLDVDGSGNILLSGITWDYRVSPNHNSIFIVKFDSSGNFLWNRNWAGSGEDEAYGSKAVRADTAGNVYLAGRTTSQPCASGSSGCDFDVLLLKLDSAGNFVWSRTWKPDTGYDTAISLAFDASGNLVLTGAKDEAGPTETAFLLRFDPAGNLLLPGLAWSGGPGAVGSAVLLDPAGDVIIAGNAPNNTGSWQPITGTTGTENGTLSAPPSAVATPNFALGSPSGIVTSPSGVVDTGGGGQDAFLSMIPASTFPTSSQPVALPSPSPLHFPNQPVNTTSSAMAISVANTGTGALSITAPPSIGGANAADFAIASGTTCLSGATVATGSSCVIDVTFAPSTTSSESATLSIHDNASNSPQSVVLTGTGVIPSNPLPTVTSFSPPQGVQGEQIFDFIITGTNFQQGATISFSGGQSIAVDQNSIAISANRIEGILKVSPTAAAGLHDVTVTNPDMQLATGAGLFNILTVPPSPKNLSAVVDKKNVYLHWDTPQSIPQSYEIDVDKIDGTTVTFLGPLDFSPIVSPEVSVTANTLRNGSTLQEGQLYRFRVIAIGTGGKSDPAVVLAEPNGFVAPPHPLHPILFLHGIDSSASTWDTTTNFLTNTLGWKSGGVLSYCPQDNPPVSCPDVNTLITKAQDAIKDSAALAAADYFTVNFADNLANYSDGIFHQGDEVGGFINFIQKVKGQNEKISIVAHSMGGLAARAYIQNTVSPAIASTQIADLVTYGTPHRGLDGSFWKGLGTSADQLKATYLLSLLFPIAKDIPQILSSRGFADMDSECYANGDPVSTANFGTFLTVLSNPTLPPSINYTAIYGNATLGHRPDECNPVNELSAGPVAFIDSDWFVPTTSADAFSRSLETDKDHLEMPSDFPSILCALDQHCLKLQVLSPVNIMVTSPNGQAISNNFTSMPGAEYMNIVEENGHETATVLVPFPAGGQYTITATPKPGTLPTDTFTILQTQNGVTTTLASNMQIANIPPAGFKTQVKSGSSYSVKFGGSVQQPLTNDGNGHLVATVTVTNQGNVTVDSAQIKLAGTTLGTASATSISAPVTNLAPGASAIFTLSFPVTAASPTATSAPFKISGTYSAGTLSGNWALAFRSVTLPVVGGPQL